MSQEVGPGPAGTGWSELCRPPAAPAERGAWHERLRQWREEARRAIGYDGALYRAPELAWTRSCFVSGMAMLWDDGIYDQRTGELTMAKFLRDGEDRFGGLDSVVLWHAYPRIGFDDRNQFDFYRQLPGGPGALRRLVDVCHAGGVRAFLAYYPWDVGTRREPLGEVDALVRLLEASTADGIFLDTLAQGSAALQERLARTAPGVALMTEGQVPMDQVQGHAASWVQWPPESDAPYVLRNKWFEPGHMHHLVRRWHRHHTDELHLAWLNGVGVVVWENVFGSENPWSAGDQELLRLMRPVQRHLGDVFCAGRWAPLVATSRSGVHASCWEVDGLRLWTVVNATDQRVHGRLVPLELRPGESYWDLLAGTPARPDLGDGAPALSGDIGPRGIGAFAASAGPRPGPRLSAVLEHPRYPRPPTGAPVPAVPLTVRGPAHDQGRAGPDGMPAGPPRRPACPDGMVAFDGAARRLSRRYRSRECGMDGPAPFADVAYPELHHCIEETESVVLGPFAIDLRPVSNGDFLAFLHGSGYTPGDGQNFLKHWPSPARPAPEQMDAPVVFVDLDDAAAYLEWAGAGRRLPTPEEWQHALGSSLVGYGPVRAWEWTRSERSDGHTRWCVLKGGAEYEASGSEWYADGGPRPPDWSAKFILWCPSLDRCATIGFRGALSL